MSASWVTTLKGMMDRGSGDLTTVDNAFKKKVVTVAERDDCYNYWYTKHTPMADLSLTEADRQITASWTQPAVDQLKVTWNDGVGSGSQTVPAADGTLTFPASTFDASATSVTVQARALRRDTQAELAPVTATVTFFVAPADPPVEPEPTPEPDPEPTPDEPAPTDPPAEPTTEDTPA